MRDKLFQAWWRRGLCEEGVLEVAAAGGSSRAGKNVGGEKDGEQRQATKWF